MELAARLSSKIRALEEAGPRSLLRVYAEQIWPDYRTRMSPGGLSFADHALRLAGGVNIYVDEPRTSSRQIPSRS